LIAPRKTAGRVWRNDVQVVEGTHEIEKVGKFFPV
jgi:hypothetical protein